MSYVSETNTSKYKYIYNLPYTERRALTQLLDADGQWEDLGGFVMKLDQVELALMGQARYRNESPTNLLLEKLGQRNGTINELFVMLSKIKHYRAMQILIEFVNPKYHHLLPINVSSQIFPSGATAMPLSIDSTCSTLEAIKKALSKDSKLQDNLMNFNSGSNHLLNLKMPAMGATAAKTNQNSQFEHAKLNKNSNLAYNSDSSNDTSLASTAKAQSLKPTVKTQNNEIKKINVDHDNSVQVKNKVKHLNIPATDIAKNPKKDSRKSTSSPTSILSSEELPQVMQITYRELLVATDNFNETRILGRGGFGIVYKGAWKGISVAIKRLLPKNKSNNGDTFVYEISLKQSLTEMRILNSCRIDNILPLYGVCLTGPEPCIVYQYMVNGSLEDRLLCKNGVTPLNWTQRAEIADGTAKGLNYLHSLPDKPLVHGDIKSANILLDSDLKAKIGDFGLAREGPGSQYTHVKVSQVHGTQVYLPPEYLRNSLLSPKVDVYSYGIVLLEICTGQRAYSERRTNNKLLIDYVNQAQDMDSLRDLKAGPQNLEWFDEMLKLGRKCSHIKKNKRPDMTEVLNAFHQARQALIRTEKIRKLSKETGQLPLDPQLSPMELQIFYDARVGPDFQQRRRTSNTSGSNEEVALPPDSSLLLNCDVLPPNYSSSPAFTSYHPSQIRAPPSVVEPMTRFNRNTSCGALAGSENNAEPQLYSNIVARSSNEQEIPYLTILGTKPPIEHFQRDGILDLDLGPTPHPSGIVSDSPLFNVNSLMNCLENLGDD